MTLPNGHYRTKAGSTVEVFGEHSGGVRVSFDWLEEPEACSECSVNPYPEDWGDGTHRLTWSCDHCGGGSAALEPEPPQCPVCGEVHEGTAIAACQAEALVNVLRKLIELKDHKDRAGKTPWYESEQPRAWEDARTLLAQLESAS